MFDLNCQGNAYLYTYFMAAFNPIIKSIICASERLSLLDY